MIHKMVLAICILFGMQIPVFAFTADDDPEALALFEGYTDAANGDCAFFENPEYEIIVWEVFHVHADALNATGLYPVGAGAFRMHRNEVGIETACSEIAGFLSGVVTFDKRAVAARNTVVAIDW
ncbi:MAG: hypothetical protein ABJO09_11625 [Hyphomicrobiales bacterium]